MANSPAEADDSPQEAPWQAGRAGSSPAPEGSMQAPRYRLLAALQPWPSSIEKGKLIAFVNRCLKDLTDDDVYGLDFSELQSVVGFIQGHMDGAAASSSTQRGTPFEHPTDITLALAPPLLACLSGDSSPHEVRPPGATLMRGLTRGNQISMSVRTASTMVPEHHSTHTFDAYANSQKGSFNNQAGAAALDQGGPGSALSLPAGDPFLVAVAPHYRWSTAPLAGHVSIEEGINAGRRAARVMMAAQGGKWNLPQDAPGPPPLELTCSQVQEEVQLMAYGLVEKGSTSMVFKCRWPCKFGQRSVLAVKVMRNLYCENLQQAISSFRYEADVLIQCRHRNIVRLYAYCLEPPTVCLITELLPQSLQARLTATPSCALQPENTPFERASTGPLPAEIAGEGGAPAGQRVLAREGTSMTSLGASLAPEIGPDVLELGCVPPQLAAILEAGPVKLCPGPALTDMEVLQLGADVATGLEHLHAEVRESGSSVVDEAPSSDDEDQRPVLGRVVHKNLKPDNILLSSKGVAKLSSFSPLPRIAASSGEPQQPPPPSDVRYMAPELLAMAQEDDFHRVSDRADIYSLGMVLWEVGTQQQPANGPTGQQVQSPQGSSAAAGTPAAVAAAAGAPPGGPEGMLQRLPKYAALVNACRQAQPERRPKASIVRAQLAKELERLAAAAQTAQGLGA